MANCKSHCFWKWNERKTNEKNAVTKSKPLKNTPMITLVEDDDELFAAKPTEKIGNQEKVESPKVRRKLVVVGDGECGKTSLLVAMAKGEFPGTYIPTSVDTYTTDTLIDGTLVELSLWDTAGQEDYSRLRAVIYPDTDVLLVCFAVNNADSALNITRKWMPEVVQHCSGRTRVILVATKIDLRNSDDEDNDAEYCECFEGCANCAERCSRTISPEIGLALANRIGAYAYAECSAKLRTGIKDIVDVCVKAAGLQGDEEQCGRRNRAAGRAADHKGSLSNDRHIVRLSSSPLP